ncbi:calcium-binding protein [Floridanema evergladense]|uniref:Calcium-binding protein n=1 Tax=Floridaenema evergladense BLCC-F167 TaxID=3153639 RepID=A0ABV4WEN4_9CYAN
MALITLTSGNDQAPPPAIAPDDTVYGLTGNDTITAPNGTFVFGNEGNDVLTVSNNSIANGNQGNDVLTGAGTGVTLFGGQGNDTLRSVSSSVLFGDGGNPSVSGVTYNDSLFSVFADTLYGGLGSDTLIVAPSSAAFGGKDNDTLMAISSGAPNATLAGDGGDDVIMGAGTGGSKLYGDRTDFDSLTVGNDTIWAFGNDTAYGGGGNDSLVAFGGVKLMYGNQGDDVLRFADTVTSGTGATLYGGQGNDTLLGKNGGALLYGDKGNDSLVASTGPGNIFDTLVGGAGADNLVGTDQAEVLIGGADSIPGLDTTTGADLINAKSGDDTIVAGGGGSTVSGADGRDSMIGGKGNDSFLGGNGDDTLIGGAGNDSLQGWTGSDSLTGGDGADFFIFVGGTFVTSAFFSNADGISSIANAANASELNGKLGGIDTITDFLPGTDRIVLDGKGTRFTGFGLPAGEALFQTLATDQVPGVAVINVTSNVSVIADQSSGILVYNTADGSLWYNADAAATSGGNDRAVQFLFLQPGLTSLSSTDFLIV